MAQPTVSPSARAWNPAFTHLERERWICIYPAYINSRKTLKEGRKIPKDKAVDNPIAAEIRDVCSAAGLILGVENKVYPREADHRDQKAKGRIRVQFKSEDGQPLHSQFPTRQSLMVYLGQTIPKLKSRSSSHSSGSQPGRQQQQSQKTQKKKGRKGK